MAPARFFSPSALPLCGCLFFKYLYGVVCLRPAIYFSFLFFLPFFLFLPLFLPPCVFHLPSAPAAHPGRPLSTKFRQNRSPASHGSRERVASRVKSFIVHRKSDWALSKFLFPCAPLFSTILSLFLRPLSTPGVSVSPRGFFVRANA